MDVVAHDRHVSRGANLDEPLEGRPVPYAADGVVRAAEHEHARPFPIGNLLQAVQVHVPAVSPHDEGILHDASAVGRDAQREGIVDGGCITMAIARLREREDGR